MASNMMDNINMMDGITSLSSLNPLSIEKYSSSFHSDKNRESISSTTSHSSTDLSPSDLIAELSHQKDLFSKHRFSYTEQMTKENFVRALLSKPTNFTTAEENLNLEDRLRINKSSLQEKKMFVSKLLEELEEKGRSLTDQYLSQTPRISTLFDLSTQISELESTISNHVELNPPPTLSDNPLLNFNLQDTLSRNESLGEEDESLKLQIEEMKMAIQMRKNDVEKYKYEMENLIITRDEIVNEVKALQNRQKSNDKKGNVKMWDDVEKMGRWWRAQEGVLKSLCT